MTRYCKYCGKVIGSEYIKSKIYEGEGNSYFCKLPCVYKGIIKEIGKEKFLQFMEKVANEMK